MARLHSKSPNCSASIALTAACLCTISCSLRLPVEDPAIVRNPTASNAVTVSNSLVLPNNADATRPNTDETPENQPLWLIADTFHTGLVVPYRWLLESGFIPPSNFGTPRYVVMSWGNTDAYSAEGFDHPWKLFRVLFTPTQSVMELIPVNWHIPEVLPDQRIWQTHVPSSRGPALAAFLNDCLEHDSSGQPRVVRKSSWGNGVQLASRHDYFIPRVCNIWTVQALEAAGGRYQAWSAITANGLVRQAARAENGFEMIWPGGGTAPR